MQMHPDQQVLQRGDVAEQPDVLIGAADPGGGDAVRRQAVDPLAGEPDLAGRRPQVLRDAVEHRRLAGAVRADDAVDAVLGDCEIEIGDRHQPAEAHGQVVAAKQRFAVTRYLGCAGTASAPASSARRLVGRVQFALADVGRPQAFGPQPHHHDQHRAIEQVAVLAELAQQFRQADQRDASRAPRRAGCPCRRR